MSKRAIRAAIVAVGTAASALVSPAHAQWGATFFGTGEYATNDVALLLAGIGVAPTKAGWVFPVGSVHAYWLRYEAETVGSAVGVGTTNSVSVFGVQPTIGVQNNYGNGMFAIRGGYQFEDADESSIVTGTSVAVGQGAVAVAQLEHWGTGGPGSQVIGSYNFGSETFWGRGRATFPLGTAASTTSPQTRVGAEVAFLAVGEAADFTSTSIGPVLEWRSGKGLNLVFGAGYRFQNRGDDAVYFKIDFSHFSMR
jgi:hypothetical protein